MSTRKLDARALGLPLVLALAALLCAGVAWQASAQTRVDVAWQTASEVNTVGFLLYRANTPAGPGEKITPNLIPVQGDALTGGDYHYSDDSVRAGQTYYYWLEEIETSGSATRHGPITVEAEGGGTLEGLTALVLALLSLAAFWQTLRRKPVLPAGFTGRL
jgi:hypothetical protein